MNNQQIGTVEPAIQFNESVSAAFDFDPAIDAEQRQ
jgi:hypothetical protein